MTAPTGGCFMCALCKVIRWQNLKHSAFFPEKFSAFIPVFFRPILESFRKKAGNRPVKKRKRFPKKSGIFYYFTAYRMYTFLTEEEHGINGIQVTKNQCPWENPRINPGVSNKEFKCQKIKEWRASSVVGTGA